MKKTLLVAVAVLAIVLGTVTYALADTKTGAGDPRATSHDVSVTASVNPKLLLTIADASHSHDFGSFEPDGAAPADWGFTVTIASNKTYNLTAAWSTAGNAAWHFHFADVTGGGKTSGQSYPASIGFTPDWNTEGSYAETLRFSATQ